MCAAAVIIRIAKQKYRMRKKEANDYSLLADTETKKVKSEEVASDEASLSTAHSTELTLICNTIELSPRPFVVDSKEGAILNLKNCYSNEWIAVRILTNNTTLSIYPTKFLLPPKRISAAEVTLSSNKMNTEVSSRILAQWFTLGASCPSKNVTSLWTRPYCVQRDKWHYKIIRIYFDFG
ncbi:unnamed protein product [Thelazia callipaeda]|uniref:Major sperm protein n=1 Tax=Thelazia callipaeda TaxID=103827 RepID=A0A0N5DC66_THECL|nr:unnamed protein product [Thelazia callipaeda]